MNLRSFEQRVGVEARTISVLRVFATLSLAQQQMLLNDLDCVGTAQPADQLHQEADSLGGTPEISPAAKGAETGRRSPAPSPEQHHAA